MAINGANRINIAFRTVPGSYRVRARQAAENLARACAAFPPGEIEVETVDVLVHPHLADEYRVLTTPTVVRVAPLPRRRATGDLADAAQLYAALALYPNRTTP